IEPVRAAVVVRPVTPRPSCVLHLDPETVLADLGAQGERTAVPGGAVQDRVSGELRRDQDRIVSPRAVAQPHGERGPREPNLPGFGGIGSSVTAGARRRGCRGHYPSPFARIYVSQPVARGLPLETGSARMPTDRRPWPALPERMPITCRTMPTE